MTLDESMASNIRVSRNYARFAVAMILVSVIGWLLGLVVLHVPFVVWVSVHAVWMWLNADLVTTWRAQLKSKETRG